MNTVTLTGSLASDSELRILESGRELLNLSVEVDGLTRPDSPRVHVAFFPRNSDTRELKAGARVFVAGALRHRRDEGGLFVAAHELVILGTQKETRAEKGAALASN